MSEIREKEVRKLCFLYKVRCKREHHTEQAGEAGEEVPAGAAPPVL
jgi:hypothetical protein